MINLIFDYYRLVDDNKFDRFRGIFSSDIYYDRCGYIIEGIEELIKFYHATRNIRGVHNLSTVAKLNDNEYIAIGTFIGNRVPKVKLELDFVDHYKISNNVISYRKTYLSIGFKDTI